MTDPIIKRGTIRSVVGVEVSSLDLTLMCNSDVTAEGVPLPQFAREGGFDGARVQLDRFFSRSWQDAACGSINLFSGRASEIAATATQVRISVKADMEILNIKMPHNIYQAPCIHTVYNAGCGLSAGAFTVTGNTSSASTRSSVNCNLGQAAGYFNLGTIKYITGANAGITRSVKKHTTGVLVPAFPFPYVPALGDHFQAKPGCDRLRTTCNATFNNTANFRGYKFIPAPELTY